MAKTKVVIFCGAGFSAFAGIPLMSTFSDALRSRNVLGGDQEEFDRIQLRCDSLGAFIGGSARNLEQLASILAMLEIDRPYYQFEECQRYKSPQQAMHLITFAMRKMVCPLLPAERVKEWTAPLLHLAKKADLSFVTTNYDLLLEFAAASQGLRIYPTGDIAEACIHENNESSLYFSRRGEHLIPLYKLHGSANWFTGKDKKLQVSNRSLHIGRMGIDPQKEWETDLCPEDRFADLELRDLLDPDPDRRFLMVPPAVTKSSEFAELLNTQWVGASEVMGEADLLWFIGYSFPETDSFHAVLSGDLAFYECGDQANRCHRSEPRCLSQGTRDVPPAKSQRGFSCTAGAMARSKVRSFVRWQYQTGRQLRHCHKSQSGIADFPGAFNRRVRCFSRSSEGRGRLPSVVPRPSCHPPCSTLR
jgi:hypothetical protein